MSEESTAHRVRRALAGCRPGAIIAFDTLACRILRPRKAIGAELRRLCRRNFLKRLRKGEYEIVHSIVPPLEPAKEVYTTEKPKTDVSITLLRAKLLECTELVEAWLKLVCS